MSITLFLTAAGVLVFLGLVVVLIVVLVRGGKRRQLHTEHLRTQQYAGFGWRYAPRDDSVIAAYQARINATAGSMNPFAGPPPRATAARSVITGTHRGRPFLAAVFDTTYQGRQSEERAIWVALPADRPTLSVMRTARAQSAVNEAIGRDLRTGDAAFDAAFEVTTEDPSFALAVLTPVVTEFLRADQRPARGFEFRGRQLDAFDSISDHRDPMVLRAALDLRCDLLDRVPPQVLA